MPVSEIPALSTKKSGFKPCQEPIKYVNHVNKNFKFLHILHVLLGFSDKGKVSCFE